MKKVLFLLLVSLITFGQKTPEDFGYKYIRLDYKKTKVDVLIQSKLILQMADIKIALFLWENVHKF